MKEMNVSVNGLSGRKMVMKRFTRIDEINCTGSLLLPIPEGYTLLDSDFAYFVV